MKGFCFTVYGFWFLRLLASAFVHFRVLYFVFYLFAGRQVSSFVFRYLEFISFFSSFTISNLPS
jgi:uncharacterized MAPEG superfamily protein